MNPTTVASATGTATDGGAEGRGAMTEGGWVPDMFHKCFDGSCENVASVSKQMRSDL